MLSTNIAPDTAPAVIKRLNLAANISISEPSDTQSNKTDEDLTDDLPRNISQIHLTGTVKSSSSELEPQTESISSHNDEAEEPVRASPTTAEEMRPFKFDLEGLFSESFSSPVDSTAQASLEMFIRSRHDPTSVFDFPAMRKRLFEIESEPKPATSETSIIQKTLTTNILLEGTVRNLLQRSFSEKDLYQILPLGAFDRLIEDPATCISSTKKGPRCKNRIRVPRDETPNILGSLASLNAQKDWEAMHPQLECLIKIVFCASPHRAEAVKWLLTLRYRMIGKTSQHETEPAGSFDAPVMDAVVCWLKVLCSNSDEKMTKLRGRLNQQEKDNSKNASQKTVLKTPEPPSTPDRQLKTAESPQRTPKFSPYRQKACYTPLPQAIREALQATLKGRELNSKYLYIYWSIGMFGYIKIGVTNDVPKRLTAWNVQCKHDVHEHFQESSGGRAVVKHAYRVETLVQTELREVRVEQVNCFGCGKNHNEWFATHKEHAAKVIKKYVDFMAEQPYQFSKERGEWVLDNRIEEEKIQKICEPIVVQASKIRPGSARKMFTQSRPLTLRKIKK